MPRAVAPFRRFLSGFIVDEVTGCWNWGGSIASNGYGQMKAFGKMVSTHRFSFELHKGPIPIDMEVMHQCDNKPCVNPDHLRLGTHARNMADATARGLLKRGPENPCFGKPGRIGIRSTQAHPVRVKGTVFGSKKEAERALCLGAGTVLYWLRTRPDLAETITREEYMRCSTELP